LSKKAIRKLKKLLDSDNNRVQMQTALGVLRATVQALTRDTSPQGAGAEIHIHTTARVQLSRAIPPALPSPPRPQARNRKPGDGTPVPPGQYIALNQKYKINP